MTGWPVVFATARIHSNDSGTSAWWVAVWKTPWPTVLIDSAIANSSSWVANVPGTSSPSTDLCSGVRDVEKPSAPTRSASSTRPRHAADVVGRGVVEGSLAHDVGAQRSVWHLGPEIEDPRAPLQIVEVLGEGLPAPLDSVGERRAGDVLDALHELDQPVAPVGRSWCEAHTAVAHHHGGDAVPTRRRQLGIPRGLGVVVGVGVDEARRDDPAVRVDLAPARTHVADVDDRLAVDRDVAGRGRRARAVDDAAVADHEVVHGESVGRGHGYRPGHGPDRPAAGRHHAGRRPGAASTG